MSRWFRVYDDLVDDPKVQRLPGEMVKALLNLWCLASQHNGALPAVEDIAFKLRMKPEKVAALIAGLKNVGLIDGDGEDLRPHNWNARQFKSDVSNERVKRHRKRKCNVTDTVTETPPDTEADTETEQIKGRTRASALASDWPNDAFDLFWQRYPNKVGKPTAAAKFETARRSGKTPWTDFWSGLEVYVTKVDDRPWCNPATWIHQQRWADQPASAPKGTENVAKDRSLVAAIDRAAERFSGAHDVGDQPSETVFRLLPQGGRG
jgi:hypothetical protein